METQRFRALIEYDGTAYFGFQKQQEGIATIQRALENALQQLGQQFVSVVGAGRTDTGVHALGQVISFELKWKHDTESLHRALNALLPADIAIKEICSAHPTFHPRYHAQRRSYCYQIYNQPIRSPHHRHNSWHVSHPLDREAMNQAAHHLLGIHDFATFGRPPKGSNSVRQVFQAEWRDQFDWLCFYIEANAFLYRMVRSIVGSLKLVGEGGWTVGEFLTAFRACDRSYVQVVAPPQGLFLLSVTY